ncbi:MAG: hypothetical protein JXN63_02490 [Candidatus Delongbacteria bacterium]|nr:hypothetical protein [Candidatus Delongbacteria bacterium]
MSSLFCLSLIFVLNIKIAGIDSGVMISIFGNSVNNSGGADMSPEKILGYIQSGIAVAIFFVSLFISLFAVSGVYPDLLKKGSIDLILSKPLSRYSIFFQRFSGTMTVIAVSIFYILIFSWIVLSSKFGMWNIKFIYSGALILIFFYNIFSVLALLSMLLKNGVVSLLLTYFIVFILSPIVSAVDRFSVVSNKIYRPLISFMDFILPKLSETGIGITNVVTGKDISAYVVAGPFLTGTVLLFIAAYIFRNTDF